MAAANAEGDEMASTLVISVGGAGAKMLAAVRDRAVEEGVWDDIEYLAIDSKNDDINQNLDPSLENKLVFDESESIEKDKNYDKYGYLPSDAEFPPEGGATKRRPVGRYYLDTKDNFQSAYENLKRAYESASDKAATEDDYVNVFILNAFGGGTGSGTYLPIAALLNFVTDEVDDEDDYRIRGIGTLPRFTETGIVPEYDLRHQVNTYVALRELRTVLDRNPEKDFEQELPLESEPTFKTEDYLTLNRGGTETFDEYFVLGFEEDNPGQNYRRRMNEMVADLILYYGLVEASEDFPARGIRTGVQDELLSMSSAKLSVPVDTMFEYLKKDVRIDITEERIDDVEEQADSFRDDQRYIDSVLELDPGEVPDEEEFNVDEEERMVSPELVKLCREKGQAATSNDFEEDSLGNLARERATTITAESDHVDRLGEVGRFELFGEIDPATIDDRHRSDESPPLSERVDAFSFEDIAEYLFYDHLLHAEKAARNEARSEFQTVVDELWAKYEEELREHAPDIHAEHDGKEHEQRAHGLANFFDNRLETLRNTGGLSAILGSVDEKIEEREGDQERLDSAYTELKARDNRVEWVTGERFAKMQELTNRTEDLNDAADILRDVSDELESTKRRLEDQRAGYRKELESFANSTHTTVPMQQLDSLRPEQFVEWLDFEREDDTVPWTIEELEELEEAALDARKPSINALANDGYVDEETLETTIYTMLDEMVEPVEDRTERELDLDPEFEGDTYRLLTMLINDVNTEDPDRSEQIEGIAKADANFDQTADHLVSIRDGSTIRLLGIYGNIDFAKMSEYGLLHEYYTDDERGISEVFFGDGNQRTNVDGYVEWAYPELVERDDSTDSDADANLGPKADSS